MGGVRWRHGLVLGCMGGCGFCGNKKGGGGEKRWLWRRMKLLQWARTGGVDEGLKGVL